VRGGGGGIKSLKAGAADGEAARGEGAGTRAHYVDL
jgi:hypothetical protein